MNKPLLYTFLIFFVTQSAVWFQANGQFVWTWFKDNPFILSLFGIPISLGYIYATKFAFTAFEEVPLQKRDQRCFSSCPRAYCCSSRFQVHHPRSTAHNLPSCRMAAFQRTRRHSWRTRVVAAARHTLTYPTWRNCANAPRKRSPSSRAATLSTPRQ